MLQLYSYPALKQQLYVVLLYTVLTAAFPLGVSLATVQGWVKLFLHTLGISWMQKDRSSFFWNEFLSVDIQSQIPWWESIAASDTRNQFYSLELLLACLPCIRTSEAHMGTVSSTVWDLLILHHSERYQITFTFWCLWHGSSKQDLAS